MFYFNTPFFEVPKKIPTFTRRKEMSMYKEMQSRYINALTDYGFKRIFGEKDIMKAFLTDLLEPASPIADITFLDKEFSGMSEYERGVVYDLMCVTEDGSRFIVEMQNRNQTQFSDRILFYLSRAFSSQEKRGNARWDYSLTPVYGIFFLNFRLHGFKPLKLRTVQLKVDETGEVFSDKLKVFTLELPEYRTMKEEDCKTRMDYWLYNLTNLESMETTLPFQNEQPIFNKIGNIAELAHLSPDELQKYNISIDTYRTTLSVLRNERTIGFKKGEEKGMKMGVKQGRAEGRAEEKLANAKSLKENGVAVTVIAKSLGLSIEDINNL